MTHFPASLCAILLAFLAIRKRSFKLTDSHQFALEFGKFILTPKLAIFSIFTGLSLTAPLLEKVGKEQYRVATQYYEKIKERSQFMRNLKVAPVKTFVSDAKASSEHLNLPFWLTLHFWKVAKRAYIALAVSALAIIFIIILYSWKTNLFRLQFLTK